VYVSVAACSGKQAATRKAAKYDLLVQPLARLFQPIAAETLGSLNELSIAFFSELDRKIASVSVNNRELIFLFGRISIILFSASTPILLHNSFSNDEALHFSFSFYF